MTFATLLLVLLVVGLATSAYAAFRAAPWLPVRRVDLPRVRRLLDLRPGEVLYDLGAGDGRILLTATRHQPNIRAIGFELSLLMFFIAWTRLLFSRSKALIRLRDFFHLSFADADVIFCFLTPLAMRKLGPKFARECKPDCRIVSYSFSIPGWNPELVDREGGTKTPIFRYRMGRHRAR